MELGRDLILIRKEVEEVKLSFAHPLRYIQALCGRKIVRIHFHIVDSGENSLSKLKACGQEMLFFNGISTLQIQWVGGVQNPV